MKTAQIKTTLTFSVAIAAALLTSACAFHGSVQNHAADNVQNVAQTVTVHTTRMTAEEKADYDRAEAAEQTVVVAAARMTEEEKAAYDVAEAQAQTVVITAKRMSNDEKLASIAADRNQG
jgi:hypothetical protein